MLQKYELEPSPDFASQPELGEQASSTAAGSIAISGLEQEVPVKIQVRRVNEGQ